MRKPILTLLPMALFLFTIVSCETGKKTESSKIVLTTENNVYEGDLYQLYLEDKILFTKAQLDITSDFLETEPNNEKLLAELETLKSDLNALKKNIEIQNQQDALIGKLPRVPRVPPVPPQPCLAGACIPTAVSFITISNDIQRIVVKITDLETKEIIASASISKPSPLPQYENLVTATAIDLKEFTGAVIIDIQRTNTDNETISYSLNGNIY
ncbi:hypothetical protein ACFSQP_08015 [Bizionia sediminis]|uniref:Uncharacterized protein n=1 Tax=Bizionia sediminis TaxID=1737064 RepID=A0ABW5KVY3_9FLAO